MSRHKHSPLIWVALLVAAAVVSALLLALFAPAERAGAMASVVVATASVTAALTALRLSRESLTRTDRQLALTRRAAVLSRYPLLLPIHQAVAYPESTGSLAHHPPTEERFRLTTTSAGTYAFLADVGDRYTIPIDNAGEGPALRITGRLWRHDGRCGELASPTVLGAGKIMVATAALTCSRELPPRFAEVLAAGNIEFALELTYFDVFGHELDVRAIFDVRGIGAWQHLEHPAIETTTDHT